jgi:hypothetical protein
MKRISRFAIHGSVPVKYAAISLGVVLAGWLAAAFRYDLF